MSSSKVLKLIEVYKKSIKQIKDYDDYREDEDYNTITTLNLNDVREYVSKVEMELNHFKKQKGKKLIDLVKEKLGSVLYVYALQNNDNTLLFTLLDNNVKLDYAFHKQIFMDEGFKFVERSIPIHKMFIILLCHIYVFKLEKEDKKSDDEPDYEMINQYYDVHGPLCHNMDNKKIIKTIVDVLLQYPSGLKNEDVLFFKESMSNDYSKEIMYLMESKIHILNSNIIFEILSTTQKNIESSALVTELKDKGILYQDVVGIIDEYVQDRKKGKTHKNKRRKKKTHKNKNKNK